MKNLLYKEFALWWNPGWFLFLLFGILLLIPAWPYFIAFGYIFIAFNSVFIGGRANQDIFFTVSLPVRKRDTVLARVLAVAAIEVLQIVVSIPFAVLNNVFYPEGNKVGMNVNFAFFGLVFLMYGIFNLFLPGFYKTAYKVGIPMLLSTVASAVCVTAADIAVVTVPVLRTNLNGMGADHLPAQLLALAAGIALFALLSALAYRIAAARFEKVDL